MNEQESNRMNGPAGFRSVEEPLGAELWRMWSSEIKPHFMAEKAFLEKYGSHAGYEAKYIARILEDQRLLEELVWKNGDQGVQDFAKVLAAHIRFKEEFFAERIRRVLESQEYPSTAEPNSSN